MKNSKRAFTIVELVIVIAVIAILAAVLIPTFSSLIEKANVNSDTAAVKQMNTYLSTDEQINGKPATWQEAVKVLNKSNLDAQNYRALSSDYYLVWDSTVNRVLYVEKKTQTVVYPEEYTADGLISLGYRYGTWTTLEGKMIADDSWRANVQTKLDDYKVSSDEKGNVSYVTAEGKKLTGNELTEYVKQLEETGKYTDYYGGNVAANLSAMEFKKSKETFAKLSVKDKDGKLLEYTLAKVNTAEQFVSYAEYVGKEENKNGENYTLILSNNVDLKGSQWKPIETYAGNLDGSYTEVVDGKEVTKSYKIENLALSDRTAEVAMYSATTTGGSYWYYGLISVFTGNYLGNLELTGHQVSNPGLASNAPTGFVKTGHATAVLAGCVRNDANQDVVIENITVGKGTITGMSRIGGVVCMVGSINGSPMTAGSITFRNITNYADVVSTAEVSQGHATAGGIASCIYAIKPETGKEATVKFENCVNYGSVTGQSAGGILAQNYCSGFDLVLDHCTNNGQINGVSNENSWDSNNRKVNSDTYDAVFAAGLVARSAKTPTSVTLDTCVNNGLVTLTNKHATGNAQTNKEAFFAAGLISSNIDANDSYTTKVTMKSCESNGAYSYDISYADKVSIAPLFGQYYALAAKALNVAANAQLGLTTESSNNTSKFDAAKINQKGLFASQELKVTNTLN